MKISDTPSLFLKQSHLFYQRLRFYVKKRLRFYVFIVSNRFAMVHIFL